VTSSASTGDDEDLGFVLVHGIGVSHRYLAPIHDALSAVGIVHSVDLPGFGGLPKPDGDLDIGEMADLIARVLDEVAPGPSILIGHSMGTQWVTELAARRPDLVSHLVLIGPVADDRHRSVLAQSTALALDTLGEPVRGNLAVLTGYLRCGPLWYLTQLRHMLAYRLEDRLGDIAQPVLIVRGGEDPIAGPEWCRRLRDRARDGSFVWMPRHRHLVQWTAPRTVRAAILDFVGSRG
jgi:pimeloyl-ACP methyl ester carboxylesterase